MNLFSQKKSNRLSEFYEDVTDRAGDLVENITDKQAATALGVVSLAIGATELCAPKALDRFLGTGQGENAGVFRVLGVREIMHGVDLLTHDDPGPGVAARTAGDGLDGMMLGVAMAKSKKRFNVAAAFALVLPVVLADVFFGKHLMNESSGWFD